MHNWTNSINASANFHVAIASQKIELIEYNIIDNPLNNILFNEPTKPHNGYITVDDKPGLGVEILEDITSNYRFVLDV